MLFPETQLFISVILVTQNLIQPQNVPCQQVNGNKCLGEGKFKSIRFCTQFHELFLRSKKLSAKNSIGLDRTATEDLRNKNAVK